MALNRSSSQSFRRHVAEPHYPPQQMGNLVITKSPIALVIAAFLIGILIYEVPGSGWFFLGALVFGGITGLILWSRHRSGF
jgi:hypothetical protein